MPGVCETGVCWGSQQMELFKKSDLVILSLYQLVTSMAPSDLNKIPKKSGTKNLRSWWFKWDASMAILGGPVLWMEGSWGDTKQLGQKGSKISQPRVDWCGQAWILILINEYSCFPSFSTGFWCKPWNPGGKSPGDFPAFCHRKLVPLSN